MAVIREEGTNGDREMVASLIQVGFEVWDVTMQDLLQNRTTLDSFKGIVFPGGFSYAGNLLFFLVFLPVPHQLIFRLIDLFVLLSDSSTFSLHLTDVLGSAKGWAASLLFNPSIRKQLEVFIQRKDTFSLGVCNGCQLMSLLGWVGEAENGKQLNLLLF